MQPTIRMMTPRARRVRADEIAREAGMDAIDTLAYYTVEHRDEEEAGGEMTPVWVAVVYCQTNDQCGHSGPCPWCASVASMPDDGHRLEFTETAWC